MSKTYDPCDLFQIEVVHTKRDPDSIYIGRGSALGNPFKMYTEESYVPVSELRRTFA